MTNSAGFGQAIFAVGFNIENYWLEKIIDKFIGIVFLLFASSAHARICIDSSVWFPICQQTNKIYSVYSITGTWHEDVFKLDVDTRNLLPPGYLGIAQPQPQTIYHFKSVCPILDKPLLTDYVRLPGENIYPINWQASLQNGQMNSSNGVYYTGEAVNQWGQVMIPFEAKITVDPVAGETIEEHSSVYSNCSDGRIIDTNDHWKYRTVEYLKDVWGVFTDAWRTGLHEYQPTNPTDSVYNYIYKRGTGLVWFWYGDLNRSTNKVTGYEFRMQNEFGGVYVSEPNVEF